jgi:mono/diheme cytochrome c family protein
MNRFGKVIIATGVSVAGFVLVAAVVVYAISDSRLRKHYDVPVATAPVPHDPELVARGMHLAQTRGCKDCHLEDLGGQIMVNDRGVMRVNATNLTGGRGGIGAAYSEADWDRAIRHGVDPRGRPLAVMPSREYSTMSDADTRALIAYLKTLPPVDRDLPEPPFQLGPLGRVLLTAGALSPFAADKIDHRGVHREDVPQGETIEYGRYLAALCAGCHGDTYEGSSAYGPPGAPPAPSLRPDIRVGLGNWSEVDFIRAMRDGRRPDGSQVSAEFMPIAAFSRMTDTELRALWLYFRSLPPEA